MKRATQTRYVLGLAAVAGLALVRTGTRLARVAREKGHLDRSVVVVTGGSRGLGLAIAEEFLLYGARVALIARDKEELSHARDMLIGQGASPDDIMTLQCDVTTADEIVETVATITDQWKRIDVVVNNAGMILVGPAENQNLDVYKSAMELNFFGALQMTLAVLPAMLDRGHGAIINIASIGGKVAFPHLLPYVASKFALVGWSEGLHAELASKGIQVTTVNPGVMRTGSHVQAELSGDAKKEYLWFGAAATSSLSAVDATTAAKKIVKAYLLGQPEICIGAQAIFAARTANLFPTLTAAAMKIANRLLPSSSGSTLSHSGLNQQTPHVKGTAYHGSLPSPLRKSGDEAISQYNQEVSLG